MKGKSLILVMILAAMGLMLFSACSPQPWSGMTTGSIVIAVPPGKVFAHLTDPEKLTEIATNIKDLKCDGKGVGAICTWKGENFGETYEGRSVIIEHVTNRKTVVAHMTNDGGVAWTVTTIYLPHPQGTKLVGVAEFHSVQLPAVLSKLPHDMVQKKLEENGAEDQKRLKAALEK
jgi:carbon monoxide dehydrogenase subunit G